MPLLDQWTFAIAPQNGRMVSDNGHPFPTHANDPLLPVGVDSPAHAIAPENNYNAISFAAQEDAPLLSAGTNNPAHSLVQGHDNDAATATQD